LPDPTDFSSWRDYRIFAHLVTYKARHILDESSQRFLITVLQTALKRVTVGPKGVVLWRAQLASDWRTHRITDENDDEIDSFETPFPAAPERMVPFTDRATEGRVNPKGIPCLYLATEKETAMTEVRPGVGSYVSVAQFLMLRDVRLIDCTTDKPRAGFLNGTKERTPEEREQFVWGDINRAFSRPVVRTDDVADYAPTQILAEMFRLNGYDGIIFGSGLGTGQSVALFDMRVVAQLNCHVYEVDALTPKFSNAGDSYYMNEDLLRETVAPSEFGSVRRDASAD
jgi:hypothetical protein